MPSLDDAFWGQYQISNKRDMVSCAADYPDGVPYEVSELYGTNVDILT